MHNSFLHISIGVVLAFFLLVLADVVPFWMPMMNEMLILLVVSVLMLVWVGFVVKEWAHDEREALLTMKSGRVAYLSGLLVLVVGLVVQGLSHAIDPWIAGALAAMVLTKLIARGYFE